MTARAVRNFACYLALGINLEGERDTDRDHAWEELERHRDRWQVAKDLTAIAQGTKRRLWRMRCTMQVCTQAWG